jgi:DNA-binding transcriptional ArsR family regulator
VAKKLNLPLPLASEYLRSLESRSLLQAKRVGRWVKYRTAPIDRAKPVSALAAALRKTLRHHPNPIPAIFNAATAFTHPRRIDIFRAVQMRPRTFEQLHRAIGMSIPALYRHLAKLQARDFVRYWNGRYYPVLQSDAVRRQLAVLTTA